MHMNLIFTLRTGEVCICIYKFKYEYVYIYMKIINDSVCVVHHHLSLSTTNKNKWIDNLVAVPYNSECVATSEFSF